MEEELRYKDVNVLLAEISEVIILDREMYELKERLKTDKEFSERFYAELEELKQISLIDSVHTKRLRIVVSAVDFECMWT